MEELKSILNDLKSAVNSPKIYLVNHFDQLRSHIDIACQTYLKADDLTAENKEKAQKKQQDMINEVDLFQKKCFANLETIKADSPNLDDLEQRMNGLYLEDNKTSLKTKKDIYCAFNDRIKVLFMNQGLVFVDMDNFKQYLDFRDIYNMKEDHDILFGMLFIVEDDFFQLRMPIETTNKIDNMSDHLLRLMFYSEAFSEESSSLKVVDGDLKTFNRIQLNLNEQEKFSVNGYKVDNLLLQDWLQELPALKKIELFSSSITELEANTFQSLTNLEHLDFYSQTMTKLDSMVFANQSLKVLKLNQNEIVSLSSETFKGLPSLTELEMTQNQISVLPVDLFQELANLEVLNLSQNKINFSEDSGNVFKGLCRLKQLNLDENQISLLPKAAFEGMACLDYLNLSNNKLEALGPNAFNGLNSLAQLYLTDNQISKIDGEAFLGMANVSFLQLQRNKKNFVKSSAIFKNLVNLNSLDISENCIDNLPIGLFEDLVNLENLRVDINQITVLPDGLFKSLGKLTELDLRGNQIGSVSEGPWVGLTSLETLYLQDNKISKVSDGAFQGLAKLKTLTVGFSFEGYEGTEVFYDLKHLEEFKTKHGI